MSLFDLKSLVSKEDFADAHEPLNDGIKEVPNAQTVAASVGTGDVGKDTTSPGPAKVVPEKPDTDEATKTEHNVVKESAEKKGSTPAAAPAAKPFPPKKEETDKPAGDKAPPFKPKDDTADKAEDDTAETELEHTSEKAAKDDLEKTEKAKEALEAYAPKAKRFDIIGHPTRQAEQIGKAIGFVQRRSGVKGEVTVSAESIDGAIALSQTRLAKLEREVRILGQRRVSAEDSSDSMGIDNPPLVEEIAVTEAPTEHGAPPMEPAAAAALTEAEIDPLDVPILEIQRVQETIDALQGSQAALEKYIHIVRTNPNMSKQAAAVLHAGLEQIDQACGLKIRATGLENYLTTPRAAMEVGDVNEKSLLDRAGELGAKILNWLMKLFEYAETFTLRFSEGMTDVISEFRRIRDAVKSGVMPATTVGSVRPELMLEGEFVGDKLTAVEKAAPKALASNRRDVISKVVRPLVAALKSGPASDEMFDRIEEISNQFNDASPQTLVLPGEAHLTARGLNVEFELPNSTLNGRDKPKHTKNVSLPEYPVTQLHRNIDEIIRYIEELTETTVALAMVQAGSDIKAAIIECRRKSKGGDEAMFQKVQSAAMKIVEGSLHQRTYFKVLGALAKAQLARAAYFDMRLRNSPYATS